MLAANPAVWMVQEDNPDGKSKDHYAEHAAKFKVGERVIVVGTEAFDRDRKASIAYIGKVPEIGPGFWIGVHFKERLGKNDGSAGGKRYFACPADHGGFVRPSRIELDPSPPSAQPRGDSAARAQVREPPAVSRFSVQTEESTAEPSRMGPVTTESATPGAAAKPKGAKLRLRVPPSTSGKEKGRAPTARMGSEGKNSHRSSSTDMPSSQRGAPPSTTSGDTVSTSRYAPSSHRPVATPLAAVEARAQPPSARGGGLATVPEAPAINDDETVPAALAASIAARQQSLQSNLRQTMEVVSNPAAKRISRKKR